MKGFFNRKTLHLYNHFLKKMESFKIEVRALEIYFTLSAMYLYDYNPQFFLSVSDKSQ